MFMFEEPSDANDDWYLGDKHKEKGKISNEILKTISNAHMIGIQFLFENFVKKRRGAILNQDEDLNMPLQVCAFLSSLKEEINENSPVLIIASESSLCKWHYHTTEVGFKPKIITSDNFDSSGVCLLSSDFLKLAEKFLDLDVFCVVIDDFDVLATKLLVKKLRGKFNIGLTKRNFYENPDQKLKWSMLNWASPGCVGKLNDFYRIDRLHSLAFADNYRFWWMRLTWKFCDSFEPPSEEDLEEYQQKLQSWGNIHGIRIHPKAKKVIKRTKQEKHLSKRTKISDDVSEANVVNSSNASFKITSSPDEMKIIARNVKQESSGSEDIQETKEAVLHTSKENKSWEENYSNSSDFNPANMVKTETAAVLKDAESDEEEPILSIIYSQVPLKTEDSLPGISKFSQSSADDSQCLSFLDDGMESSTKSQTYHQISDVLDHLSDVECKMGADSDDDSFFSDLISGNK